MGRVIGAMAALVREVRDLEGGIRFREGGADGGSRPDRLYIVLYLKISKVPLTVHTNSR